MELDKDVDLPIVGRTSFSPKKLHHSKKHSSELSMSMAGPSDSEMCKGVGLLPAIQRHASAGAIYLPPVSSLANDRESPPLEFGRLVGAPND